MRFTSPLMALPLVCATLADLVSAVRLRVLPAKRVALGLMSLLWLGTAHAVPTDFNDKVEAALLCRSEWDTGYWTAYFSKHLPASLRDWGDARWWDAQGAKLGGAQTLEVFANLDTSRTLIVGALIDQRVEDAKRTIEQNLHVTFRPVNTPTGTQYVTDTLSVLLETTNQKTKWFCAKWNMGNRERVKPLAP